MKIKLKLTFIIFHQSCQGSDPLNKHFQLQTEKKRNKMLKAIRKGLAVDVTMHSPDAMEEYNSKCNNCGVTFISAVLQPIYK